MADDLSTVERFWAHVERGPGCWLWTGRPNSQGYGVFTLGSRRDGSRRHVLAHRYAWELHNGSLSGALCVLHDCPDGDNPACVRPDHLWTGTRTENNHDRDAKGRNGSVGEENRHAVLNAGAVVEIRRKWAAYDPHGYSKQRAYEQLAVRYGVSPDAIRRVVRGQTWRHRGPWVPSLDAGRREIAGVYGDYARVEVIRP